MYISSAGVSKVFHERLREKYSYNALSSCAIRSNELQSRAVRGRGGGGRADDAIIGRNGERVRKGAKKEDGGDERNTGRAG